MNIFKPLCDIHLHAYDLIVDDGLHRVCERCNYHEKIKELVYGKNAVVHYDWVQELGGLPEKPYNGKPLIRSHNHVNEEMEGY